MKLPSICLIILVGVYASVLGACATAPEPWEYEDQREVKSGPGLFSGEDGVFTIYRKPLPEPTESEPDSSAETPSPPAQ